MDKSIHLVQISHNTTNPIVTILSTSTEIDKMKCHVFTYPEYSNVLDYNTQIEHQYFDDGTGYKPVKTLTIDDTTINFFGMEIIEFDLGLIGYDRLINSIKKLFAGNNYIGDIYVYNCLRQINQTSIYINAYIYTSSEIPFIPNKEIDVMKFDHIKTLCDNSDNFQLGYSDTMQIYSGGKCISYRKTKLKMYNLYSSYLCNTKQKPTINDVLKQIPSDLILATNFIITCHKTKKSIYRCDIYLVK